MQVATRELTQAEAARRWRVDVSTVIGIRRTVRDAALAALSRGPGRPAVERNYELEAARDEIAALTEAVKAQAIELAWFGGKPAGPTTPAGPGRGEGAGPQDRR